MPYDQYANSGGVSKHELDAFSISPLHYWSWHVNPDRPPKKETPASLLGSAIHTAVLEPERFDVEYIIEPQPEDFPNALDLQDSYKKACKDLGLKVTGTKPELKQRLKETVLQAPSGGFTGSFFDEIYQDLTQGKKTLSRADMRVCRIIAARVRKHPFLSEALKEGKAEQSVFWKDADTGVLCRARPDWMAQGFVSNMIIDLKSTTDASPVGFQRSIIKYRYHVQAAMYLDAMESLAGEKIQDFLFAAWEKTSPFANAVYCADTDMIEAGRKEYKQLLRQYARCLESDTWPGYSEDVVPLGLPEWYKEESPESERDWLDEMSGE